MGRAEDYRRRLRELAEWDAYLLEHSGLPGPRGNLELVEAVADEGDEATFRRYLGFGPRRAPAGSREEFLAVCGTVGLGRLLAEGRRDVIEELGALSADPRWRVREGVAMALQRLGKADMEALLAAVAPWAHAGRFAQRAAAAALCEPVLLRQPAHARAVLAVLDEITASVEGAADHDTYAYGVLCRGLGYCWSVAAAAAPEDGLPLMERWCGSADVHVRRIIRDNLGKARLERVAPQWVMRWRDELGAGRGWSGRRAAGEARGESDAPGRL
jgi:hypothetical protein